MSDVTPLVLVTPDVTPLVPLLVEAKKIPPERDSGDAGLYLPQLSFKVVTRLNTGLPGCESTRSATK